MTDMIIKARPVVRVRLRGGLWLWMMVCAGSIRIVCCRGGKLFQLPLLGIVAQALFNISVVLSLVPTKGIPLPFISYGGSSLVPTLAAVGILLNVSQHASGNIASYQLPIADFLKRQDSASRQSAVTDWQ